MKVKKIVFQVQCTQFSRLKYTDILEKKVEEYFNGENRLFAKTKLTLK